MKSGKEFRARTNSSTTTNSTASSELSKTDPEEKSTSSDDIDSETYHTLDEMSDNFGQETSTDECDDQGYNIIQDCQTKQFRSCEIRGGRRCRPLPQPPSSDKNLVQSVASALEGKSAGSSPVTPYSLAQSPVTWESTGYPPGITGLRELSDGLILPSLDASKSDIFPSLDTSGSNTIPPSYTSKCNSFPPKPRPHRRLVDLEEHQYLGLVYLRPNEAAFSHDGVSEVKLVRTRQGNLVLVSVQEGSLAFPECYTRIYLIDQAEGSLGVVGVLDLDLEETPSNESPALNLSYTDSASDPQSQTCTAELKSLSVNDDSLTQDATSTPNKFALDKYIYISYFGSVCLDEGVNLEPCDYLTALDIDINDVSAESGGYLTVRDVGGIYTDRFERPNSNSEPNNYLELIHEF
ncbi:hypothetical protein EGW08_006375 [Elysia chlorotica]|uniref:Uncharacterized protein n=1 Tax=Elysia chlorotica TaxID=188477 RepID=A0A433TWC4_ELYCH|nr:hypothetical protein EGW08_006375 [Elysia chlorotica]